MKILITTAFIFCNSFAFSQSKQATSNKNSVPQAPTAKIVISDTLTTPKTNLKRGNDEGTNNPTTNGAIKQIVNGKEVYVKETEVNGIKAIIIYEPK